MMHQPTLAAPQTMRRHFMMYTPRAQAAFQHQQFFFEQKEKLAGLLNTVGQDAKTIAARLGCTGHAQLGSDYHELTTVTTQLLEEAQAMSAWTFDVIERSGVQMQPFEEKVRMVEQVASQLRARAEEAAAAVATPAVSKKRSRARDDDDDEIEVQSSHKRGRGFGMDHEMSIEPAYCGPYAERFLQTAWWTQQVCE